MDRAELLALMDRNMVAMYGMDTRATPGGLVVEAPGLVMCRTPHGTVGSNMTIVTGPVDVARVRAETARVYRGTYSFSVWTPEHGDAAMARALGAAGFREIHREPVMVLEAGAGHAVPLPRGLVVRPVVDDAGRVAYGRVLAAAFGVYDVPEAAVTEHFATLAGVHGPDRQAFLAWEGDRAVAGALLYMAHGVGGIGWVGTVPEAFRRGFGAAVVSTVVEEGLRRGARFMNLQASPMGAPLYARMGFTTPTHYRWFLAPE